MCKFWHSLSILKTRFFIGPLNFHMGVKGKRDATLGGLAMKKATLELGTLKQAGKIIEIFADTPREQVQAILPYLAILRDANIAEMDFGKFQKMCGLRPLTECEGDQENILASWRTLYRDMGIEVDFSHLRIPARREGFDRLLVIPQGLTIEAAYAYCATQFPCWRWTKKNLDEIVTHNDRDPKNGSYAIWVRDGQEPDEEWKNHSANQLAKKNISGVTLLEWLIYQPVYFKKIGKHLDMDNWTLCTGSRYDGGDVPSVGWNGHDRMVVGGFRPDGAYDSLRAREVVS